MTWIKRKSGDKVGEASRAGEARPCDSWKYTSFSMSEVTFYDEGSHQRILTLMRHTLTPVPVAPVRRELSSVGKGEDVSFGRLLKMSRCWGLWKRWEAKLQNGPSLLLE